MDIKQAKRLTDFLLRKWRMQPYLNLNIFLDRLWEGIAQPIYRNTNTFEFSLVSFEKKLRFLHIYFYDSSLSLDLIKVLRRKRIESIINIIKYTNHNLKLKYNLRILSDIIHLDNNALHPIQFGCEINKNNVPVIKVYFSHIGNSANRHYLLREIYDFLGFKQKMIKEYFLSKEIDAIGFDFFHNGNYKVKFYPFNQPPFDIKKIKKTYYKYQSNNDKYLNSYFTLIKKLPLRHLGFLYRISEDFNNINSAKIWARLQEPIFLSKDLKVKSLIEWWNYSRDIIEYAAGKISYLTLENEKLGVYFR